MKNVLIIGGASAIAHQTAICFASAGAGLYLADLSIERLNDVKNDIIARYKSAKIEILAFDALDYSKHEELINNASAKMGGLDYVLIAHGILPDQDKANVDIEYALKMFEVNCTSAIALSLAAAKYFEPKQKGMIAVISSVAGDRGRQSNYIYGAAKGGVTVFLQGLRNRLAPNGVGVLTIKPGQVDTPMTADIPKTPLFAKAEDVGKGIFDAMTAGKDIAYVPGFWRIIMCVVKAIPEAIFKKMKM